MELQRIFKNPYLKQLRDNIIVDDYRKEEFPYDDTQTKALANVYKPEGLLEKLDPTDDFKTAKALYEAYKDVSPLVASLPNLWVYLTHVDLFQYVQKRWPKIYEKEVDEKGIPLTAHLVELEDGSLAYEDVLEDGTKVYYTLEGEMASEDGPGSISTGNGSADETEEEQEVYVPTMEERLQQVQEILLDVFEKVDRTVQICLFWVEGQPLRYPLYLALIALWPTALLLLLLRRPDEAFSLVSAGVNVVILLLMLAAPELGLPTVMQQSRISIYLNYMLPVLWVMTLDRILYVLFGIWRAGWLRYVMNTASLAVAVAGCVLLVRTGCVRQYQKVTPYQSNEAVTCLTNIIREEKDFSWTIVSAYDEMRMGEDHGYHEELNTFLKNMEYTGGTSMITLPSKTLFFFVEKRPLDYSEPYEGSGQTVSAEGASRELPAGNGFTNYMGENRWIMMSRFYEWAKMFQKMHPYAMTVYFENENFICYKLEQNDYHLYNLSIDYGYNNVS